MRIRVRAFATLRDALGPDETVVAVDADATVRDALAALEREHDELEGCLLDADGTAIQPTVTVLLNGNVVHRDGAAETALADGDELVLSPPVTGG